MSPVANTALKRVAWGVIVVALAVGAGWWGWTRSKPPAVIEAPKKGPSFVQLARGGAKNGDKVLEERSELFDPTPLFFPTDWNYGQRPIRINTSHEAVQVFPSIPPQFVFQEQGAKFFGAEFVPTTEQLPDVLAQSNEAPFTGFGQVDMAKSALPQRAAFVEVKALGEEGIAWSQALIELALPRPDFAPLEFLLLVNSTGVVGEPVLASGSGADEVDSFFRSYLIKTLRLGQRLAPGKYRVVIGP